MLDVITLLQRLGQRFRDRSADDSLLLAELHLLVAGLFSDPRIDAVVRDLSIEAHEALNAVRDADASIAAELIEVRRSVAALPGVIDDSAVARAPEGSDGWDAYEDSFARFDVLAARDAGLKIDPVGIPDDEGARTPSLLRILRNRMNRHGETFGSDADTEAAGVVNRALWDAGTRWEHSFRAWLIFERASGAAAMVHTLWFA